MRILFILLTSLYVSSAFAIVESQDIQPDEFSSPAQKHRFKALIKDLRCTVCQNQNLADSNASLARDLRREVFELIQSGKTDDEITQHLVARYGEFVLYKPRFEKSTYVLWLAPFFTLLVALAVFIALIRRRTTQVTTLSSNDKQALADALRDESNSTKKK